MATLINNGDIIYSGSGTGSLSPSGSGLKTLTNAATGSITKPGTGLFSISTGIACTNAGTIDPSITHSCI